MALAGCGGSGSDGAPNSSATLTLDTEPNAVHAGIELAVARGFTDAEGVDLTVQPPVRGTDSVALLETGRTDFAILDLHDLARARGRGKDLVAVMAIVEDPLTAVIAKPGTAAPRALVGKPVAVSTRRADIAALRAIVPGGAERVPIGARTAAATVGPWYAAAPGAKVFRVEDHGAPAYPELVLAVTRETLQDYPDLVRATVYALQRGYRETIADPESAVEALIKAAPGTRRAPALRQLDAVTPAFQSSDGTIGTLDAARLEQWAAWEQRSDIVGKRPEVALMFDGRYARSGAKQAAEEDG
jgi:ABC-type nitrate/sulfonate/bicarbonate transport system substrate-binding protein